MKNIGFLEGRNPILEALKSGRVVEKVLVQDGENVGSIKKIIGICKDKRIPIVKVPKSKLDSISETKSHQGVIAYVSSYEYKSIEDMFDLANKRNENPFILILDEIEDPHNLGSIMRTAECAGAHGIIIPKRRSVGLTSVVAKTSAGAIEYIPVAKVSNISMAIEELKQKGLWIYGADMNGKEYYFDTDMKGPIGLVIGAEGKGISRLVREKCDFLVRIPLKGKVTSLNASVAASIIMYEILKQRIK